MKTNAPKKVYFSQTEDGRQYLTPAIPFEREYIEYTCTDAFIEKACEYMRNHIDQQLTIYHEQTWKKRDEFIRNFKRYMKGE